MATCCVEGCEKTFSLREANVNSDNLHQDYSVSFHRFPRKKVLRQKWLKAIGKPDWDAPSTAHVCSRHFSSRQLQFLHGNLYKIKDEGYPDSALPISGSTSVAASKLKVCRFCLATNVKMFSLQSGVLKTCLETIVGLHENHDVDGLPQYLCYICAAYLLKMYNVIEKSMIAQATLLEIYAENFEITKSLIFEQNRQKLNLVHTLQSHNTTPCTVYDYVYDDDLNVSILTSDKLESDKKEEDTSAKDNSSAETSDFESEIKTKRLNKLCRKLKQDIDESLTETYEEPFVKDEISERHNEFNSKITYSNKVTKLDNNYTDMKIKTRDIKEIVEEYVNSDSSESDDDNIKIENGSFVYIKDHNYSRESGDDTILTVITDNVVEAENTAVLENKNKKCVRFTTQMNDIKITDVKTLNDAYKTIVSRNRDDEITAKDKIDSSIAEPVFDHYFNTVELTLEEQKQRWSRSRERPSDLLESAWCGVCSKWVRSQDYLQHVVRHDPKWGDYECQVCKVRFAKAHLLKKHVVMTHSRKYICKICSAVVYTIVAARHHRAKHEMCRYPCGECSRSFSSSVGLRIHVSAMHSAVPRLKSNNVCKACNMCFASQLAQCEHWFTCPARNTSLWEAAYVSRTCNQCGQQFDSRKKLEAHKRNVHGLNARRGEYPAKCDNCNVILRSRAHQRGHMLKLHPDACRKKSKDPRRSARLERKVRETISSNDNEDKLENLPPIAVNYECPICDSVFKSTFSLNEHILNVHQRLQFTKTDSSKQNDYNELDGGNHEEYMEVGSNVEIGKIKLKL